MPRPSLKTFIDLSNADDKRRLIAQIGAMSGLYEIDLSPRRETRSTQQNRWYFGCLVQSFVQYMNEQDYEITTPEECHEFLKARFLARTVTDKRTGKPLGRYVESTTRLTKAEFSDYCERCRTWLNEYFGIVVPDPA